MRLGSSHWHENRHEPPLSAGPERSLGVLVDALPPRAGWRQVSDETVEDGRVMWWKGAKPWLTRWREVPLPSIWIPVQGCPINKEKIFIMLNSYTAGSNHYSSFSSVTQSCLTLCDPMNHSTPGLPIHHQLPESTETHVHWVGGLNHLILCRPLLLLPSIFPSIRVFSNESALRIKWPKYWSFSFNISPSNEHPGLISFRMDWLDLLAIQGTLKSLLQHHSSRASILRCSAFFTVQLSYTYMTTV